MPNNIPTQNAPQQQISRAAETATRTAERLESEAERVTGAALDKVRQAREEAQSGIEQQRDMIAHRVRRVGDVLRSNGQIMGGDDPLMQQLFETAGDGIERVASYIDHVTPGDLASDLQTLARRSPGLFFGGSFLIGLALGRFAKSSGGSPSREQLDEYEQTQTAQRASQRQTRSQTSSQETRSQTSSQETRAQASSQASAQKPSAQSSALPRGVGSSAHGTVGTGSAHNPAPNAPPSYGGIDGGRAAPEESARNVNPRAHAVEPGEGSKS